MKARIGIRLIALICLAGPCTLVSGATKEPARLPSVRIEKVPHVKQKPDFCGEACVEMYLRHLGHTITQDDVFNESGLDPLEGRGCATAELKRALERIGFKPGDVWYRLPVARKEAELAAHWRRLHADLARKVPSIVCMRTADDHTATEHFRLILGYDSARDRVIYHEPAAARGAYREISRADFIRRWPLKYDKRQWTLIRFRLAPGKIKKIAPPHGLGRTDFAQHIRALKEKVPRKGFTIVIQEPFVVVGDEPPPVVRARALRTVKWAVDKLKACYFKKDPNRVMDVWLFKDKESYRKHTRSLFNDRPTTPFGYCSPEHDALIMNIATGGGTLVHEMVHAFMDPNFPECPSWFNEGLASLYEQSTSKNGRIWGLTNWRLAGLQKAIRAGHVPSFETLTGTTTRQFYNEDPGTNYSQARYLCYYLQEKGLLRTYYRRFVANAAEDPTGYDTLKEVLGEKDMAAFKKKWESYVMKLRFP
jgi:hypothetical protein